MQFINRTEELHSLNARWSSKNPQLIVVYGKRRVGKTELIKQFIKDKPSVYYLAEKSTIQDQLKELGRLLGRQFDDNILISQGFPAWIDVYKYLKEKVKKPFIFAIDEFPYLVETDQAIGSIFQKGWDEYLKDSKVFLILSGSSVSMMESETLLYKAPLFGRRTGQILLKPLTFYQSWKFHPKQSFVKFIETYSLTGGMPAYLTIYNSNISVRENFKQYVLPKTEFLHNEIEFILREELREPRVYMSILRAISWGKRKLSEIVNETGIERNVINKYLGVLEKLQLIEREVAATESNPEKSRKGLYKICDNYARFWFQYVFPYRSGIEMANYSEALTKFDQGFLIINALIYEHVVQEILSNNRSKIFNFEKIGKWWDNNTEIDIVGINSVTNQILFGEVKWSSKPVGTNIYRDLKQKSELVKWGKLGRINYYVLFSKSGFTPDMIALAKKDNVILFHQDKLIE